MPQKSIVGFEEAIKKCGFGRFNLFFVTVAGGLMAAAFLELTAINFILSIAQCDFDLTATDKGILSSIGYVGVILSSHFWGFLADTQGRRATLIPSLLIAFLMSLLSSLANNFWLLVFFRFLNGFFISCASSTTFAYLGEFHDARNRGRVLMITSIIYSILSLFLPTFALVILNQDWSFDIDFLGITYTPWRFFLVACATPNLICGLALIFYFPESPKFVFAQGDEEKTLRIFQEIYQVNTGKSADSFEIIGITKDDEFGNSPLSKNEGFFQFMWSQTIPLFKGQHLKNMLTACFLQFAVCNTSNGFWTFLPEILNKISLWTDQSRGPATLCEIFGADRNQSSSEQLCVTKLELGMFIHIYEVVVLYGVSYSVMSLIINRAGKLVILVFILLSCAVAAFSLTFVNMPSVTPFLYLYMMVAALCISVINASTVELFPTKMRAMAVCVSMCVGRIGSTSGSIILGLIIENYCSLTFLMPTILLTTSAVLAFTIPNISKRVK